MTRMMGFGPESFSQSSHTPIDNATLALLSDVPICNCSDIHLPPAGYQIYNFFVIIISVPILATFGLLSNVSNIFVYSRACMVRVSGNVYLAALASSDFFVVFTGIFLIWMDSARAYINSLQNVLSSSLFVLTLGNMAQTMSVYFTIGAALDCYIKVRFERSIARCWCRPLAAFGVVLLILVFAVGFNLPRFWMVYARSCRYEGSTDTTNEICPTQLFMDLALSYNVYTTAIIMTFVPFILLSLLNILIIRCVRAQQRSKPPGANDGGSDTVTLVMVVIMFLACNTLSLVITVVETFLQVPILSINYMTDMSNLLVVFNSSVNILIYIYFDKDYRRCFIKSICMEKEISFESKAIRCSSHVPPVNGRDTAMQQLRRVSWQKETPVKCNANSRYSLDEADVWTPMTHETQVNATCVNGPTTNAKTSAMVHQTRQVVGSPVSLVIAREASLV